MSVFSYAAGVPDAPDISISGGIASWNLVNPRSSGSINYHLTALIPDMILVGEIDVSTGNLAGIIMQDLSVGDLNLQVDVEYTICVTAENEIGESDPGCVESYIQPGNHTIMSCWVCYVALPCLFDLACFFLSFSHLVLKHVDIQ